MTASAPRCASRLSGDGDARPFGSGSFLRRVEIGEELSGRQEPPAAAATVRIGVLIFTRSRAAIDSPCEQRDALVQRFFTRGAVEEKIDRMIAEKRQPADDLAAGGHEIDITQLSGDELIGLVRLDVARGNPHSRS